MRLNEYKFFAALGFLLIFLSAISTPAFCDDDDFLFSRTSPVYQGFLSGACKKQSRQGLGDIEIVLEDCRMTYENDQIGDFKKIKVKNLVNGKIFETYSRFTGLAFTTVKKVALLKNKPDLLLFLEMADPGSHGDTPTHIAVMDPATLTLMGEMTFYSFGDGADYIGLDHSISPDFLTDIDGDGNREILTNEVCAKPCYVEGWAYGFKAGAYHRLKKWENPATKTIKDLAITAREH